MDRWATVIGKERLETIRESMQPGELYKGCQGNFILRAQEALYGSGVTPLPESELVEVLEFLESVGLGTTRQPNPANSRGGGT